METLLYLLIIVFIGIVVAILLIISTRNRRAQPEIAYLGSGTEPEALLWVDRLRSVGIWADVRHLGDASVISIEIGSLGNYEVWVRAHEVDEAREILGLK